MKEIFIKYTKKYNTYDLTGGYGIGYTLKGEEFYFDLDDYDKIKDYCWSTDNDGYIVSVKNNKGIKLSRLVMNANKLDQVDHIFHNLNDNRKHNLRIVTNSQNQMNAVKPKNNTSGVKGVSWHKNIKRWIAKINFNNKQIHIGSFSNFEDAVEARKQAEEKLFKDYNFNEGGTSEER
jgi:hypothetical protein